MSKQQAVKALRRHFQTKKSGYQMPGHVVIHLNNETNEKFGLDGIRSALEYMERTHEVTLERAGKIINGVTFKPKPKPQTTPRKSKLDLTPIVVPEKEKNVKPVESKIEVPMKTQRSKISRPGAQTPAIDGVPWSPTSRRIRELTPGMKDYLEDSQCSPVVVRKLESQTDVQVIGKTKYATPENLQRALDALRSQCNPDGLLQAESGIDVIVNSLGVPRSHANYMFTILGHLELKVSSQEGRKWSTIVAMEPKIIELTEAMISAARPDRRNSVVETQAVETAQVMIKDLDPPSSELAVPESTEELLTPDDILQCMNEIIEDLETQCAVKDVAIRELQVQNSALMDQNTTLMSEVTALQEQNVSLGTTNTDLRQENADLTEKLEQKTLISSKVADKLQRYPTSRPT